VAKRNYYPLATVANKKKCLLLTQVLDQHTLMDFYNASSLKQQYVSRHVHLNCFIFFSHLFQYTEISLFPLDAKEENLYTHCSKIKLKR
jgi:hypothetical protein